MVSQITITPGQRSTRSSPSLLINTALVSALNDLITPITFSVSVPRILCLGNDSTLVPTVAAHPEFQPLDCRFIYWPDLAQTNDAITQRLNQQSNDYDAVVLFADSQLKLTMPLLRQIKQTLAYQGRLIVVTPYKSKVVAALQRALKVGENANNGQDVSVDSLFQGLFAEGFHDPYLRLVGGLPGFWTAAVCSVTPTDWGTIRS